MALPSGRNVVVISDALHRRASSSAVARAGRLWRPLVTGTGAHHRRRAPPLRRASRPSARATVRTRSTSLCLEARVVAQLDDGGAIGDGRSAAHSVDERVRERRVLSARPPHRPRRWPEVRSTRLRPGSTECASGYYHGVVEAVMESMGAEHATAPFGSHQTSGVALRGLIRRFFLFDTHSATGCQEFDTGISTGLSVGIGAGSVRSCIACQPLCVVRLPGAASPDRRQDTTAELYAPGRNGNRRTRRRSSSNTTTAPASRSTATASRFNKINAATSDARR